MLLNVRGKKGEKNVVCCEILTEVFVGKKG